MSDNQELLQRRRLATWYGKENTKDLDEIELKTVLSEIDEQVQVLIEEGREGELMPRRTPDYESRKRMRRLLQALGGRSIGAIAKSERPPVQSLAVTESIRYSLLRLAMFAEE